MRRRHFLFEAQKNNRMPITDEPITKVVYEPYPVRFEPITVLVAHTKMSYFVHLCMDGPMDTNSVKNGATVMDMRQKLNYTDFWHGSRLA